jgi:hypothetical protein
MPRAADRRAPLPVGQQAEVADPHEPPREHVEQLCGGANYVARPSATPAIPQR